jgi:rRNA maturation RNase YbeY
LVKNLQIYSEEPLIKKKAVHSLISSLKSELKLSISFLSISLITSSELEQINKKYLRHDFNTDVITFNYSIVKNKIDGEILISFEDAMLNSKKYKVKYGEEILRLIVHGILHLVGYDDNTNKNKAKMKSMENKLINKYNFTLLAGRDQSI